MSKLQKLYLGTNTKMYKTIADTVSFLTRLDENTVDLPRDELELFVIPSFTTLKDARACVPRQSITLGAQNMGWEERGQFTGEISPLMLQEAGYNFIWAFFMSLSIYAGSGQYLGVTLLATAAGLGTVALMTLLINFRHLVYGLSMLEKFRGMGWRKLYMIFSLTDETYALLSSARAPVGVDPRSFYFAIALLDQSYWVLGSVIGGVAGALIPFSTEGVDFAMTALFVVIAVDQWKAYKKHLPALIGGGVTVVFLIVLGSLFGQDQMLLISLGVIVLLLLILRERLEEKEGPVC